MTNTNPRTRRQLREALAAERIINQGMQKNNEDLAKIYDTLDVEHREAQRILYRLGYEYRHGDQRWVHKTGQDPFYTRDEHDKLVKNASDEAAAGARRETLAKVIEALELTEYDEGVLRFQELLGRGALLGPAMTATRPIVGPDKFWSDINTTLEHREAEKHAETQRKIAEKVAGLTKKHPDWDKTYQAAFIFAPADPVIVNADNTDLLGGKVDAEKPTKKKSKKSKGDRK